MTEKATQSPPRAGSEAKDPVWIDLQIGFHHSANTYLPENVKQNAALLEAEGVHAPSNRLARSAILGMLEQLDGLPPIKHEEDEVLARLLGGSGAQKLFMSDDRWAAPLRDAFSGDTLYADIAQRVPPVAELFASSNLQISITLLNPALFLHESLRAGSMRTQVQKFIERIDPATLRWRDTVLRLREALPNVPLVIWCEEDAPLIWPKVLRRVFGLAQDAPVTGGLAPVRPLLEDEGFARLEAYLEKHPTQTQAQYERVIWLFLDKYARPEVLSPQCDIPGWHADVIDIVTMHYEEDMIALAELDGVTFIVPEDQPE